MKSDRFDLRKVKFTRTSDGGTIDFCLLEITLGLYKEKYNLNLDPDFQRAHVWSPEQQTAYLEYLLQGGGECRDIIFNNPNYALVQDPNYKEMVLVDGKQRLEAVRKFQRNELPVFGGYVRSQLDGLGWQALHFRISELPSRKDVLRFYLELNRGGTVHTPEELERVAGLLEQENK